MWEIFFYSFMSFFFFFFFPNEQWVVIKWQVFIVVCVCDPKSCFQIYKTISYYGIIQTL